MTSEHLYPGVVPIQEARANAILLPAGAWDAAPLELDIRGANDLSILFTYTRGGAAGAFDFMVEVSPWLVNADAPAGAAVWYQTVEYEAANLVAGADSQSRIQREYFTYLAVGGGAEAGLYGVIKLGENASRVRISARESGNIAAAGTLQASIIIR